MLPNTTTYKKVRLQEIDTLFRPRLAYLCFSCKRARHWHSTFAVYGYTLTVGRVSTILE